MNGTNPARLLIVDDESAQMRALCETLNGEGHHIRGYSCAQQALADFRAGEFDLLITDLMMPEMDGITLSNSLRALDPAIATIVMTGHGTIDTAVSAIQGGVLDYVLKPFKLNVILSVVARALDMQQLRRENTELQALERRQSEELAAAYRDLESFSYSISHDLRAPLRTIQGFSQILEEDFGAQLDGEIRRIIGVIRGGSQKMDQLIVGLLEFSRIGRGPLDFALSNMTAMAREAVEEMMVLYVGPKPRIDIADLPEVAVDRGVFRQVWRNLIGNALKYSAKRAAPWIKITGRIDAHEGIYQVQDNGAGFDPRYADKIFGVFQRLHRAEDFSGTGIGLAIVHRIVTRHGGRIWAQGEPDVGACFQFALPIVAA